MESNKSKTTAPPLTSQPRKGVAYSVGFDDVFDSLAFMGGELGERGREFVNQPRYTVRDTGATYRIINHWASQGLLPERREKDSAGWRKLSIKDLLWLEIVKELREFGFPIEKIKKTFDCLISEDRRHLEVALGLAIRKEPVAVFVLVFDDGTADIGTEHCIDFTDHIFGYQTFLRINVNAVLKRIFPQTETVCAAWRRIPDTLQPRGEILNEGEKSLLDSVRDKKNHEVRANLKEGKVTDIESTKKIDKPNVFETLKDMNYGEVTIQVENGKPVYGRVKRKKKVKP